MKKRKIAVITGTRAEYGLLYWIIKGIRDDPELELQLMVTGMHLSPEFGMTVNSILEDDFPITKKIETLLSSDTPIGVSKSMGLGMISFSEAFIELEPDLCLVLGDRFEIFSAVSAAMIARIPVTHCHGGEATEGLVDEPIRHSITKMSHLHFTSTEEYRNRVIQLGEQPNRVFNVGALGIENIYRLDLLDSKDFENSIGFELGDPTFLVTYHPVTLENKSSKKQCKALLRALDDFQKAKIIFTMPNADTHGKIFRHALKELKNEKTEQTLFIENFGKANYFNAMKYSQFLIGNTSSGIIEAAVFGKYVVNVGNRQKGRLKNENVITCAFDSEDILTSVQRIKDRGEYTGHNLYIKPNSSETIIKILKSYYE